MRDRNLIRPAKFFLLAMVVLTVLCSPALAYIGPGAGLEFIGYFSSLIALLVAAFSSMLLWPFYALLRWLRGVKDHSSPALSGCTPVLRPCESGLMQK
jgi:hypothetical protein